MKKKIITIIFSMLVIGGILFMADKNIQMGQRNAANTEWDNHFPATKAGNVITTDGNVASDLASIKTNKADKTYVDTLTASIASGSPKGIYATAVALTTAFPAGNTNIYLVSADGKWYYWNGTAWTAGGTYQSTGLADGSITDVKLSFLATHGIASKNLFNKNTVIRDKIVSSADGTLVDNTVLGNTATDYIRVEPSTSYKVSGIPNATRFNVAYYNVNKTFISGAQSASLTTPAGCYYLRYTIMAIDLNTAQIEKGTVATDYESHDVKVDIGTLPLIPNEKLEGDISRDKLGFLAIEGALSKNLFNKTTMTAGKYVMTDTGGLATLAGYNASDWISVLPNTQYTINNSWDCVMYDANKTYIALASKPTFTTTASCYFVRVTVLDAYLNVSQLELGDTSTAYESYGAKIIRSDVRNIDTPYLYEILLPDDIYLVSGEKFSIYFDGLIKYYQDMTKRNCYIAIQEKLTSTYAVRGQQYNYKWEYVPLDTDTTFDIEFRVVSTYDDSILARKVVTFNVANSSNGANHGRTATFVTVGDSFPDNDDLSIVGKLYNNITTKGGTNSATFIGMNDASLSNTELKDDTWAGKTYSFLYNAAIGLLRPEWDLEDDIWDAGWGENETYGWTTGQTYSDLTETQKTHGKTPNPFYNPSTLLFDFNYYMTTYMGSQAVDGFISAYGLNDVAWGTVTEAKTAISAVIPKIQHIIDSVHTYDSNIKVLLYTLPKQKTDNNTMGSYFTTFAHYERVNHNIELFNEMLIENFDGDTNVYVVPSGVNFDSEKGYKTTTYTPDKFDVAYTETWSDDIHPSDEGGEYIADSLYQAIYNLVLE